MKILEATVGIQVRTATFSDDEKYRYCLDIVWNPAFMLMTVIGLNPSTADHMKDDNTIRRVIGFAGKWGYGGLRMLNAFALRSTDPKAMFKCADPDGIKKPLEYLQADEHWIHGRRLGHYDHLEEMGASLPRA